MKIHLQTDLFLADMSTEFRDCLRRIIKENPERVWESVSDLSSGTSITVKKKKKKSA